MDYITFPEGFTAAGVACGIKKEGPDLAVVLCERIANAAGIFTKNRVKGHSLRLSMKNIAAGRARLAVINAGNANACMGSRGDEDALEFARIAAERFGCSPEHVLTASTGVIGFPLPLEKIRRGLETAVPSREGGLDAARAIMTTDTVPKQARAEAVVGGKTVRIGGMAKGSGMIHPDMATMISVITTDALISPAALKSALVSAAGKSFNRISVDGETSVCDCVMILASGMASDKEITEDSPDFSAFLCALTDVCVSLSRMLAADGEGATKLLTIKVNGARTRKDARLICGAVARSPLCKTAAFGCDANWGRILTAAGYSGAVFDPEKVDIYIGTVQVCRAGGGLDFDEEAALNELRQKEVVYTIELNEANESDVMWTCDFSPEYVNINANYRT